MNIGFIKTNFNRYEIVIYVFLESDRNGECFETCPLDPSDAVSTLCQGYLPVSDSDFAIAIGSSIADFVLFAE